MTNPKKLSKLMSESIDEFHDDPAMEPKHFAAAVNAVIAAAPHGQQQEVIKKLIEIGKQDKGRLIDMLEKLETNPDNQQLKFVQDFYRSKASNITLIAKLAQTAYDNEEAVEKVLDAIDLSTQYRNVEDEDEDLYNSEGDGYSH